MVHRKVRDEDGGDDQLDEAGHPPPGRRSEQRRKDSGRKRPDQVNCSASEIPTTDGCKLLSSSFRADDGRTRDQPEKSKN